jgi:hypothetical protein
VGRVIELLTPFGPTIARLRPEDQAFEYPSREWTDKVGPDPDLAAFIEAHPSPLSRGALFGVAQECAARPDDVGMLRQLLFGAQLWGWGTRYRFGPGKVKRMASGPSLGDALVRCRDALGQGNVADAYRALILPQLGPAFLSKTLYFLGPSLGCQALIIDQYVARTLSRLLGTADRYVTWRTAGLAHDPDAYASYVDQMTVWAGALGCTGDQLEMFLREQREGSPLWLACERHYDE